MTGLRMAPDNNSKRPRSASELAESAFAQYVKALHRYLMRRLENAQNAHDLAQEAYLRLVRLEHSELVRAPQAYLFRIAANLVYEFRMRQRRDVVTFDSRMVDYAADRVSDPVVGEPGERLNIERQLESVLDQLPPLYAAILLMKKRDGKSVEEIAKELNISIHTVKKYLFRAIAHCRAAKWDR
jgi:RNA polymerase sigma factor (sigma-70 family)